MDYYHGAASLITAVVVAPAWAFIDPVIDLRWWMWIVFALFVYGMVAALFQWALFDNDPRVSTIPGSRTVPQAVKLAVAARDAGRCRRCGSKTDLQYDHVVPYSLGGRSDDPSNIQLLCGRCNRRKSNKSIGLPIRGVAADSATATTQMRKTPSKGHLQGSRKVNQDRGGKMADRFCGKWPGVEAGRPFLHKLWSSRTHGGRRPCAWEHQ